MNNHAESPNTIKIHRSAIPHDIIGFFEDAEFVEVTLEQRLLISKYETQVCARHYYMSAVANIYKQDSLNEELSILYGRQKP